MKIIFMGTPDFADESLKKLISEKFDIAAVFTQPDKPKGRGMELAFSPVKVTAIANNIPVYQPVSMKDPEVAKLISEISPDILVVVAYGKILPESILSIPKYGAINVHASLLPKYRGSAPIQWAVINGDRETGVSTMYLAREMDTGDIIYTEKTEIGEFETSGQLFDRLMVMGADLLVKSLNDISTGTAPRIPQDHSKASYVTMLDKSLSPIDWNKTDREIIKHIYGMQPWPVAVMNIDGLTCKVFAAEYTENKCSKAAGCFLKADNNGLEVACAEGKTVLITEIQVPGKKRMKVADFLRGHKITIE